MYDIERVGKIVSDIDRYFEDLEKLNIKEDELEDRKNFYSLSMVLFSIINRAIDLGEEVVMAKDLGVPSTYREIFVFLTKEKIIDKDLGEKLSKLVFYRNLLSHEYYALTEKDLSDIYKGIPIIQQFTNRIRELMRGKS